MAEVSPTSSADADSFYLPADKFFPAHTATGLTFDDVSLATNYSEVLPRETSLETRISESISLHMPVISSDMDTVTEAEMAIAMALHGGMGLIHYNMPERAQVKQVARVKNHVHGLIKDPITVSPDQTLGQVLEMIENRGFAFRSFPVVDETGRLAGLLAGRVVRPRYASRRVADAMAPRSEVTTIKESQLGHNPIEAADRFFTDNMGIHKLLVVDADDRLCGMITLSDIERIAEESKSHQRPARDERFRLRCGAAVSVPRTPTGEVDSQRLISHIEELVHEGVDAIAVSTAHGHTKGVGESIRLLRSQFPDLTLIAGNVTSAEGVEFLAESGANAVKVGQGPGSICTTRTVAGVGIPQLTALYVCSRAAKRKGVSILADGGISKSGDIVKALTLADAVICGGLLAGCREAPGKIIEINGKLYKEYRGMGSHEAMKAGSAARYGHERKDAFRKIAAEGVEALKELSGSVYEVLDQLLGGIQSGMGYLGAPNLEALRQKARYIRVTSAGRKEAGTHDIIELKTADRR
jgi:IMP dehydrogenase